MTDCLAFDWSALDWSAFWQSVAWTYAVSIALVALAWRAGR
jgi:hypothetical protein